MESQERESIKERFRKEFTEWTVKYVEAEKRFSSLLHIRDVSKGAEFTTWHLTIESLAELDNAQNEVEEAQGELSRLARKITND